MNDTMNNGINVVYYTQNLRDLLWVLPIWRETGGTFCSELEITQKLVRDYDATLPFAHLPTKNKLTIGRDVVTKKLSIKRKQIRLEIEHIARELRPDVVVTTSNHRHAMSRERRAQLVQTDIYWNGFKQVQAFHGVSSKGVKFNNWMSDFDLLLLPGRREKARFEQLFREPRASEDQVFGASRSDLQSTPQMALIGHPKADRVLRGEITRESARHELQLGDKPTVLYAPTHGALSSFFAWGESIINAIPTSCNLIVKPHPSLATTSESEGASRDLLRVRKLLESRGALWLPHAPDVMPLMAASDVLITDYSSVAEEWLVFDRPIVFADHLANATGRDRAQRERGDWNGIFACGHVVTEIDNMKISIDLALSEALGATSSTRCDGFSDGFSAARQQLRDEVFEQLNGNCARRAADAIRALVVGHD